MKGNDWSTKIACWVKNHKPSGCSRFPTNKIMAGIELQLFQEWPDNLDKYMLAAHDFH